MGTTAHGYVLNKSQLLVGYTFYYIQLQFLAKLGKPTLGETTGLISHLPKNPTQKQELPCIGSLLDSTIYNLILQIRKLRFRLLIQIINSKAEIQTQVFTASRCLSR